LVFDNFETVDNPVEVFEWVNEYIRLPNKILITTRFRQFKGDYPIEVSGMSYAETVQLIDTEAHKLGIHHLLTDEYRQDLYNRSGGHPYVIKIFLGEIASKKSLVPLGRVIETRERILEALFERTFRRLTPAAKRTFLTLCSWSSIVPLVVLKAVMLHSPQEGLDVSSAIEELSQSSLVEILESDNHNEEFVTVPLAAVPYGQSQVEVLLLKNKIQSDVRFLEVFGPVRPAEVEEGLEPSIRRFFRYLNANPSEVRPCLPIAKFVAYRYPPTWKRIVNLYEQTETIPFRGAKDATRQYILSAKTNSDKAWGWRKLADLCARTNDSSGEINALLELCQLPTVPFKEISYAAGRFLSLFKNRDPLSYQEKNDVITRLVEIMESRVTEAYADDLGRLVWLCLHISDVDRAKGFVQLGMIKDPRNRHIQRLAKRLSVQK
jgi:hypothetical protein